MIEDAPAHSKDANQTVTLDRSAYEEERRVLLDR